VYGY
jgi:hypothetical protein